MREDDDASRVAKDLASEIPNLAVLYDRFVYALDPFSPAATVAERAFNSQVANLYDWVVGSKPTFQEFRRHVVSLCRNTFALAINRLLYSLELSQGGKGRFKFGVFLRLHVSFGEYNHVLQAPALLFDSCRMVRKNRSMWQVVVVRRSGLPTIASRSAVTIF